MSTGRLHAPAMSKFAVLFFLAGTASAFGNPNPKRPVEPAARRDARELQIQAVADELRRELSIANPVLVAVVPTNSLMASVEPIKEQRGAYRLSVERAFLQGLDDVEVRAVVAHELGHVWIYTHHPYLQTEQLANKIAMRLVSRETLQRVYGKVWGAGEFKGSLASFLGIAAETQAVGLAPKAEPVKRH